MNSTDFSAQTFDLMTKTVFIAADKHNLFEYQAMNPPFSYTEPHFRLSEGYYLILLPLLQMSQISCW